jgi:hypothetical protein
MNNYEQIISILKKDYSKIYQLCNNEKEYKILASFYSLGNASNKINHEILKNAFLLSKDFEPKNLNDFYSLLLYATKQESGFNKKAYPNMEAFTNTDVQPEFDLNKWAKLVYKIYDAVLSSNITLKSAIDYYANTLDKENNEPEKFKDWIKYYVSGENQKYSSEGESMKKISYQFGLNNVGFYPPETTYHMSNEERKSIKEKVSNSIDDAKKKQEVVAWKAKIDNAVRRIDKLIRSLNLSPDQAEKLFNSLHQFDLDVNRVKHDVTASDLTFRAANRFKKLGFNEAHNILLKTSQEIAQEAPVDVEDVIPDQGQLPGTQTPQQLPGEQGPSQEDGREGMKQFSSKDPLQRVYENVSGAKEGEYEKLSQDITLQDAINKLEEIAARLSDRRVIRLLAEFDIMLDKIGIASMFPELAESQSKLIDGYSYALVRVTKMLGMLSSGKNLSEISEARKDDLTSSVRKDVDKSFAPKEEPVSERGEEAIRQEFEQSPPAQPRPQAPPVQS